MSVRQDKIQLSVEINGTKAGSTYRELVNQARNLGTELRNLVPGTDAFIRKSEELKKVNNVLATIRKETQGVAQGTNSLTDIFKKGVAASLAFFSVQRITEWGKQFVGWITRGTVALEDMRDKTERTFGDAIEIVEDFAAINASALGVTEEAYASLASNVAALLIPMGFTREEAARMSTEALNVAAALSEWSNGTISVEQANEALGKALQGQVKGLKTLGVSISESDIKARLAAEGQDKLTGAALKQAKAQATLQLVLERTRDAQADFIDSQDDAGRAVNRITAYWEQQKESILSGILPAYKAIVNAIANTLSPIKRQSDLVEESQAQFNIQIETLKRGNISQENRGKLIDQINSKYKEYLPNLISEKTTLSELNVIQDAVNQKFTQRILLLATVESLRDVSKEMIRLKTEELDLAQKQIAAEQELAKFDITKVGQGREGQDQAFIRAATAAQGYTDQLNANKKAQEDQQKAFEATSQAAQQLGLDINAILNPPTPTGGDDAGGGGGPTPDERIKAALAKAQELIRQEQQLRIRALDFLVLSEEEYNARKEVINLETENKLAEAQIRIGKNTQSEILALRQQISDREQEIIETNNELELALTIEQIGQERELRIAALRQEYDDEVDLQDQIKLVRLQAERDTLQARLASANTIDAEYLELQNRIAEKDAEILRERLNITKAQTEEAILIERELAIAALDQQLLDEEDYQKAREQLNLIYDIRILEARLATVRKGTLEALEIENQIRGLQRTQSASFFTVDGDFAASGGSSTPGDKQKQEDQVKQVALQGAQTFADTLFAINANRIDQELQAELAAIDAIQERKLLAAGDDEVLRKKITLQAEKDRAAAEKRAADERKKLARKEAEIQGALAVVEALPNGFAVAAAVAATVAQLAIIDAQKFAGGGYTGPGLYKDSTGQRVAGVVHQDEWVAPASMVKDPATAPLIERLERIRVAKRGFAYGGYTTVSTTPQTFESTSTGGGDIMSDPRVIQLLEEISRRVGQWPTRIQAEVSLTQLNEKQAELDYITSLSKV